MRCDATRRIYKYICEREISAEIRRCVYVHKCICPIRKCKWLCTVEKRNIKFVRVCVSTPKENSRVAGKWMHPSLWMLSSLYSLVCTRLRFFYLYRAFGVDQKGNRATVEKCRRKKTTKNHTMVVSLPLPKLA